MLAPILLALLNGVMIGASRAINGRLSVALGPARTSLWNHAVGFAFLTALVLVARDGAIVADLHAPASAYLGGLLGIVFVAANSHVLPRLGATRTTILVISAQMVASVGLDSFAAPISSGIFVNVGATFLIVLGVRLARPPAPALPR
jgi:bacterial/archaeal transporter family-2 protein